MPRNKSTSLVEKATKFKGISDSGIVKSWMICEVIRQELGLSIDKVVSSLKKKVEKKQKENLMGRTNKGCPRLVHQLRFYAKMGIEPRCARASPSGL